MPDIIIKIVNDEYTNKDCISNTIHYIYHTPECNSRRTDNLNIYSYGIRSFPPTYESLIQDFTTTREVTNVSKELRYIWHLIFSFDCKEITEQQCLWIDSLARLLGLKYPVCYSYHYDTDSVHCHMIISATSFLPNTPALTGPDLYKSILPLLNTSYFSFRFIDEGGLLNV